MPTLFAACFEGPQRPSFDVRCLKPGRQLPDGWGIGFYPKGEACASLLKEAAPQQGAPRTDFVEAWDHLESSVFIVQLRTAHWGPLCVANTQPFVRSFARRDYLFAHAGSLERKPDPASDARFLPVGSTDSEALFCLLLERVERAGASSLGEIDPRTLQNWFEELRELGDLTLALCDGSDLLLYAGYGVEELHICPLVPPLETPVLGDADLMVDLAPGKALPRKGLVASSHPLSDPQGGSARFERLQPGRLLLVRQGAIVADVPPPGTGSMPPPSLSSRWLQLRPDPAPVRTFEIRHLTVYSYSQPVQRSTHVFRVEPLDDRLQRLERFDLSVSVDGKV
ncbi:MAG TPA: class II glutamine amidotransferase, partial [Polyangiaceae bacterium]|nr:class II glutamine amidotransferase [Polyangiaceae bacterium]